jgi:hypothetical protein
VKFQLGAVLALAFVAAVCESPTVEEGLCGLEVGVGDVDSRSPQTPGLTVQGSAPASVLLEGSPFSDPDVGARHGATEWQVDEDRGDWLSLVASCVSSTDLTSWPATGLTPLTRYQARVRYRDEAGRWSGFSPTIVIFTPATAPGDLAWVSVTAGDGNSCGIVTGGRAFCWGSGPFPGKDIQGSWPLPVPLEEGKRFSSVWAGMQETCAVTTDDLAHCWGMYPLSGVDRLTVAKGGSNSGCGLDRSRAAY